MGRVCSSISDGDEGMSRSIETKFEHECELDEQAGKRWFNKQPKESKCKVGDIQFDENGKYVRRV